MKILVSPTSFNKDMPGPALQRLEQFAGAIVYNPHGRPLQEDELIELLDGCSGFIAGLDFIGAKVINAAAGLRVISRYGAGVDRVDLAAAQAKNIRVCATPGANANAVADLAFGLALAVARKIPFLDKSVHSGQWPRAAGIELFGKTMGILGLGAVGKGVARRAQGFSMKVLAYDPFINTEYAAANNIQPAALNELLQESDVISLHLPIMPETRHIIGRNALETMKAGAILVNTARGGLIDEEAAAEFLKAGRLGGLALDAFEQEPPPPDAPLFAFDNVVMTPHAGAHTAEAAAAMAGMAVTNLIDILEGRPCPYALV